MEIIGFTGETFIIRVLSNHQIIFRTYYDLNSLSKLNKTLKFPATSLKKLMTESEWNIEENTWNPQLTKSLNLLNHYLNQLTLSLPEDCQIFCDNLLFEERKQQKMKQKQSESYSRELQQYFMSTDNINLMVQLTLTYYQKNSLCIEPSCGDGRLLAALTCQENVSYLIGCDIDPIAGNIAKQTILPYSHKCHVVISNFLDTSLNNLFPSSTSTSSSSPISSTSFSNIIVFGGPPYTAGGGTGNLTQNGDPSEDTGRDLPFQFIVHSAVHLFANVIIFLLPVRCSNEIFIERCKHEIETQSQSDSVDWIVSHVQPSNNEFDFCGRLIRQPVIIQIWERRSRRSEIQSCEEKKSV